MHTTFLCVRRISRAYIRSWAYDVRCVESKYNCTLTCRDTQRNAVHCVRLRLWNCMLLLTSSHYGLKSTFYSAAFWSMCLYKTPTACMRQWSTVASSRTGRWKCLLCAFDCFNFGGMVLNKFHSHCRLFARATLVSRNRNMEKLKSARIDENRMKIKSD